MALNSFGPGSFITSFRDHIQRTISRAHHSQNIQSIYEELLESPTNDTAHLHFVTESSAERIDVVNKFAARVFLRGRSQDGSSGFTLSGQGLQIPDKTHRRLGALFKTRGQTSQNRADVHATPTLEITQNNAPANHFHAGAVASPTIRPPPSTSDGRPQIPIVFSHRPGRWHITLQQESDVIPLICYLANEHPKSICVISHSRSAFPYGDIFETISTYPVVRSGKKSRSIEDALVKFSQWGISSGLCLLRGISAAGNQSANFPRATGNALIYWGLPPQISFLWPNYVAEHQFTHVYLITSSAQLPTVTSLTGDAFQAHPDSASLNAHGPGSLLHPSREKSRKRLENLSRGTLRNISKWYQPIYPPIYSSKDFVMRVMLRSDL